MVFFFRRVWGWNEEKTTDKKRGGRSIPTWEKRGERQVTEIPSSQQFGGSSDNHGERKPTYNLTPDQEPAIKGGERRRAGKEGKEGVYSNLGERSRLRVGKLKGVRRVGILGPPTGRSPRPWEVTKGTKACGKG